MVERGERRVRLYDIGSEIPLIHRVWVLYERQIREYLTFRHFFGFSYRGRFFIRLVSRCYLDG